jgi:hypothetical protein
MRTAVRIFAALNALFGIGVGLMCILAPHTAADSFHVDPSPSIVILALIRMLGGLLATSGLVSLTIARDPEASPLLTKVYGGCLLLNVAADAIVITSHELRFDQVAVGMLLELVLGVLLLVRRR